MPSTKKLSLFAAAKKLIAKFLLSFCGIASLCLMVVCAIFSTLLFDIVNINSASATSGSGNTSNVVGTNISSSIAIRLLDSTASTDITRLDFNLTPTAPGTSFNPSISQGTERTVVDVATSNPTGYKLYMQSNYQDSSSNYTTDLVHTTSGTPDADIADVIPTYVPGSSNSGSGESGGSSNGSGSNTLYWNYTNPMTSSATVIPAHGNPDKLDQYYDATNSRQTPVDINVSVDTTIVSGSYQNQLLFSTVANPTELDYTVSFNTNGGSMSGADIEETAAAWTKTITVPGAPSETDYTNYIPAKASTLFTGWVISIPSGSTATAVCSTPPSTTTSSTCKPGDNLTITAGTTQAGEIVGDVVLTAQYESISTMQAMTPTICDAAAIGASTTLTDARDTNTYTIGKLKDGNCWMTQNLRLISPSSSSLRTLSLADSNVALNYQITASDNGVWCFANTAECINQSKVLDSGDNDYGVYYNLYAATAGTGTYELSSGNVTSSVCPKGWRLPTGGEGGEFQVLANYYNTFESMTEGDPTVVLAGKRVNNVINHLGDTGYYYASIINSNGNIQDLLVRSPDIVNSLDYGPGYQGLSVRCLAHDNSYSILGVDPNGGTWNGSTSGQTFTQAPETTQTISNPSTNASYTISYDMGSTGITTPTSPTSASRSFTGWALSGAGSFAGATYEYGTGNGLLTAQYSSTSSSFNLPTLSKSGYNCAWHQGSASGAVVQSNVTISGNTTFYAVCEVAEHTIANSTYLQEVTSCPTTLTEGQQYQLTDQGETSKKYYTARLKDNKCWMTTNYNRSAGKLTSTYYHVSSSGYTIPTSDCTTSSWSSDSGQYYCNNSTYGGYYSWKTAAANDNSTSYDICPKGWRLPTKAEFDTLISTYGAASAGSKLTQSPVNMVYGGFCSGNGSYFTGCPVLAGGLGYYWSSTTSSSTQAYELIIQSSSASINVSDMHYGDSVRCVFGS